MNSEQDWNENFSCSYIDTQGPSEDQDPNVTMKIDSIPQESTNTGLLKSQATKASRQIESDSLDKTPRQEDLINASQKQMFMGIDISQNPMFTGSNTVTPHKNPYQQYRMNAEVGRNHNGPFGHLQNQNSHNRSQNGENQNGSVSFGPGSRNCKRPPVDPRRQIVNSQVNKSSGMPLPSFLISLSSFGEDIENVATPKTTQSNNTQRNSAKSASKLP